MDDAGAPARVRRQARLTAHEGCGVAALAAVLEPALVAAAGPGATCVSVSLEFAKAPGGDAVLDVEAWVERATRTLVFVAAEARAGDTPAGSASAIFSR